MAFKLIESAQRRGAPHLVALVRAGSAFVNGKFVERPEDEAAQTAQPEAA
jgi:putative transposase